MLNKIKRKWLKALYKKFRVKCVFTCFPHFQSGPRITRAPTPSIVNLGGLLTTVVLLEEEAVTDEFAFCVSICGVEQAISLDNQLKDFHFRILYPLFSF